jgi:hypothetical protein
MTSWIVPRCALGMGSYADVLNQPTPGVPHDMFIGL